jgi:hypothetical protein
MPSVQYSIAATVDDAYEQGDGTFVWSGDFSIPIYSYTSAKSSNYKSAGLRWDKVQVPKGVTISAAYARLFCYDPSVDDMNAVIYGNDADDPNDFQVDSQIINRVRTSASVSWVALSLGAGWVNSPDISAIIQEIINRGGWAAGNAIVLLFIGNIDSTKHFEFRGYEWGSPGHAELHIDYEEPSSGLFNRMTLKGVR